LMPDADERGRKAIDQFFQRPGHEGSALDVPSDRPSNTNLLVSGLK
jgi:hypothetical protein